jgi:hypothetical protein
LDAAKSDEEEMKEMERVREASQSTIATYRKKNVMGSRNPRISKR